MTTSSKKIVLKKLASYNTIWHPESSLVFKSQKERIVIGRYVDDEIIPFDDEALSLCEKWKFKPDESLFDDAEKETDEDPPESQEEEEVECITNVISSNNKEIEQQSVIDEVSVDSNIIEKKEPNVVDMKESSTHFELSPNSSIKSVTEQFTMMLYAEFDKINHEKSIVEAKLQEKEEQYSELQKKYDDIKKKFDTMKSLLN
jgi:hypothetical protein